MSEEYGTIAPPAATGHHWHSTELGDVLRSDDGCDICAKYREAGEWRKFLDDGYVRSLLGAMMESVRNCDEVVNDSGLCTCARRVAGLLKEVLQLRLAPHLEAALADADRLRSALQEAIEAVEGRPRRSPFVAVDEWRVLVGQSADGTEPQ